MFRLATLLTFCAFAFSFQAQTFSRGVPAGAMSPEPDGRQHGVPASAVSPSAPGPGVHGQRQFGNINQNIGPRHRFGNPRDRRNAFVPIPVFYPVYGYGDPAYTVADPYVPAQQAGAENNPPASGPDNVPSPESGGNAAGGDPISGNDKDLREAYLQGARDALAEERDQVRKGDSFLVARGSARNNQDVSASSAPATPATASEEHNPATVFIFKDGHQIETRNFAIVGQTLYDFSDSGLKKVQLTEVDREATTKANDDRGVAVKLP